MGANGGVGHRPRAIERFLLSGERCVVAVRRHWIVVAEPWLTALGSLILVAWLTFDVAGPRAGKPLDLLWLLWFALLGRAFWASFDHRRTWFVATDRRLLMVYGFLVRKVAMMPLAKVTDMSYHRSPLGWVLGYGTFVLESAGQDQALRTIDHVPHPDPAYRAIVSEIFHKDVDAEVPSVDNDGEYGHENGGEYGHEDDPTQQYALSPDTAQRWGDRLRGLGRGRREAYAAPRPDPSVGAQHRVHKDGEWLYRSGSDGTAARDENADPPRDSTGYWA